jgi:hypothetical protein
VQLFEQRRSNVTLLDRLLHHADVTAIEGDSYRRSRWERVGRLVVEG